MPYICFASANLSNLCALYVRITKKDKKSRKFPFANVVFAFVIFLCIEIEKLTHKIYIL